MTDKRKFKSACTTLHWTLIIYSIYGNYIPRFHVFLNSLLSAIVSSQKISRRFYEQIARSFSPVQGVENTTRSTSIREKVPRTRYVTNVCTSCSRNNLYVFVIARPLSPYNEPVSLISDSKLAGSKINATNGEQHGEEQTRKSEDVEYLTSKLRMNLTTIFPRPPCLPTPIFRSDASNTG